MKQTSQELVSKLNGQCDVHFDSWCIKNINAIRMHFHSPFLCNIALFWQACYVRKKSHTRRGGLPGDLSYGSLCDVLKIIQRSMQRDVSSMYLSPKLGNLLERQEWEFSALSSLLHKLCTLVLPIQLSEWSPLWSDLFPEWLVICWLQAVEHHKKYFIPSPFSTEEYT